MKFSWVRVFLETVLKENTHFCLFVCFFQAFKAVMLFSGIGIRIVIYYKCTSISGAFFGIFEPSLSSSQINGRSQPLCSSCPFGGVPDMWRPSGCGSPRALIENLLGTWARGAMHTDDVLQNCSQCRVRTSHVPVSIQTLCICKLCQERHSLQLGVCKLWHLVQYSFFLKLFVFPKDSSG